MVSEYLEETKEDKAVYATANGVPYTQHPLGAQTAGPGGPLLLQDLNLMEDLSHFVRERIPERVVHAKGGGAHGYFELTDSLSDLTYALPFQTVGYKCPVTVRFSTVAGDKGTADTLRDSRGFALKFRTEIGDMDGVMIDSPVFWIRDPLKFSKVNHSQKRDPVTNLNQSSDSYLHWDYLTSNPETIHQFTYQYGKRGIPKSWAEMHGYSSHTFKLVNSQGEITYIQMHVKSDEGFQGFYDAEGKKTEAANPDYHTKDLYERIATGQYPKYTVYIQTMTPKQAEEFRFSIYDMTKVWPYEEFPLRKVGQVVLNKNPENYHAEVEQAAFSPSSLVPGFEPSNDPVLQARLHFYNDTQRYRLGVNYQQLPVNRSRTFEKHSGCPFLAGNFQRDGAATFYNQEGRPNFLSTTSPINAVSNDPAKYKDGLPEFVEKKYLGVVTETEVDKYKILQKERAKRTHEENLWLKSFHYISGFSEIDLEQPRILYEKVYNDNDRADLVEAVVSQASNIGIPRIKERVPLYCGLLSKDFGGKVAKGLGVKYNFLTVQEYVSLIGEAPPS